MTDESADDWVERTLKMFNGSTGDQGRILFRHFVKHDAETVEAAVYAYAEGHTFLNVNELLAQLDVEARRRHPPARPVRKALPLSEQERQEWAAIDEAIAAASDAELARHQRDIVGAMPPGLGRDILERSDPRVHRALKKLVAERLGVNAGV